MNGSIIALLLLNLGLILALSMQLTEFEDKTALQMAQPLAELRRTVEQDIIAQTDTHRGTFQLACAALILPYEHHGPIDGDIQPNRSIQMECQIGGERNNTRIETRDPYYKEETDEPDVT